MYQKRNYIIPYDAEDVVQEAWTYIFEKLDEYNPEISKMTTWIFPKVRAAVQKWKRLYADVYGHYKHDSGGSYYKSVPIIQFDDLQNESKESDRNIDEVLSNLWFYDGELFEHCYDTEVIKDDDKYQKEIRKFIISRLSPGNKYSKIIKEGKQLLIEMKMAGYKS